jgi:hypothetical protein
MEEQKQDCFFYTEDSLPLAEQKIRVMCMKCHEENPDIGWFWEGSRLGYGPFVFACSKCEHIIFDPKGEHEKHTPSN